MRVTYALGAEMLIVAGVAPTRAAANRLMEVSISSGRAAQKFQEIVEAQGGDPAVLDDPSLLPQSRECELFPAPRSGVIAAILPRAVGQGIISLGGGRTRMEDAIDHSVGFVIGARPGDLVREGEPLATIFAADRRGVDVGMATLREAIQIADEADLPLPLLSHRVTDAGAEVYEEEPAAERILLRE
jgi:thymidine phosphorylase